MLDEIVVTASKNSNMKSDRAGAITNIGEEQMAMIPTVGRSMNDIMRLTPQGANTGNGFAVGGGNYRQSSVTVDGAAFSNSFGTTFSYSIDCPTNESTLANIKRSYRYCYLFQCIQRNR